ncbi:MAG TPA: hypothetical protein PLK12_16595, partial [Prolixibacteraceae bacterium]|nr:hypothetical protein [Prolixibacteraceae bacterium]
MKHIHKLIFATLLTGLPFSKGVTQDLFHYRQKNLELIYFGKRYSYMMPHAVATYDNALSFHTSFWDYQPDNNIVILNDFSDVGHGGATVTPQNQIFIGIEPYSLAFSIIPSSERFQWLFNHELVHITLADKANKTDQTWRKLLGGKITR